MIYPLIPTFSPLGEKGSCEKVQNSRSKLGSSVKMAQRFDKVLVLHIGTTKLLAVKAAFAADGTIRVDSWQRRDPKGFEEGLTRDSEAASETMKELLESVATTDELYGIPLYVVLSNAEIRNYSVSSSLYFPIAKTIEQEDIDRVTAQTRSVATIPLDETVIWTVPQEYLVNDLPEIKNPLGLEGKRLSVTLHLFTMRAAPYRGILHLLDRLELEVEEVVPKVLASSSVILREDEKTEGVLVLEMGGTLTELAYFGEGTLRWLKVVPWGGESVTDALGAKWGIPPKDAKRLKEEFGTLEPETAFEGETLSLADASGRTRLKIPVVDFHDAIRASYTKGIDFLAQEIEKVKEHHPQLFQVVFSGGATKLNGFLEWVQGKIPIPSRLGFGTGIYGPQELLAHPGHNAVLGLLKHVHAHGREAKEKYESLGLVARAVHQVKSWIHDYL